jgi:hypothetical protein
MKRSEGTEPYIKGGAIRESNGENNFRLQQIPAAVEVIESHLELN